MAYAVKFSWHEPVGQFATKRDADEYARQMREANRQAGLSGAVKVIKIKSNPKKSSKRIGKALKKYVKRVLSKNPRRTYLVQVPPTSKDRGYNIKISAPTAASAKAAARKYCAKRAGVPLSQFHLPKRTTVKVI
jgi:hypothetical protein